MIINRDIKRGALALTDQIIVSATNFLTLVILANYASQQDVGIYYLSWTLIGFCKTLQDRVIAAPYLVFIHTTQDETIYRSSVLAHQLILGIFLSIAILLVSYLFDKAGVFQDLGKVIVVMALSLPLVLFRDFVRVQCFAKYRYNHLVVIDIFVFVLQIGGVAGLVYTDLLTISGVLVLMGLACILPSVVWIFICNQRSIFNFNSIQATWAENWLFSKWLVLARGFGIAGYYSVPWIVLAMMDQSSAGILATASGIAGIALMFIVGTNNYFLPKTSEIYASNGSIEMMRFIAVTVYVWSAFLLLVVVVLYLYGEQLMGMIFGASYSAHVTVVFWVGASILTVAPSIAFSNGLSVLTRSKDVVYGEFGYFVTVILASLLFIPIWGLAGAGIALTLAGIVASFVAALVLISATRGTGTDAMPAMR